MLLLREAHLGDFTKAKGVRERLSNPKTCDAAAGVIILGVLLPIVKSMFIVVVMRGGD